MLSAIGASVIDRELPVGLADDAFTPDGRSSTTTTRSPSAGILAELAGEVRPLALAA